MKMFSYNVKTLGLSERSVVVSAAIVEFDVETPKLFSELVEDTLLVKFDTSEQVGDRVIDPATVEFWKTLPKEVQEVSLGESKKYPQPTTCKAALGEIQDYIYSRLLPNEDFFVWTRGHLSQVVSASLSKDVGSNFIPFWRYMDTRTAVNLLYSVPKGVTDIDPQYMDVDDIMKQNPVHDVVLDALMIAAGVKH